MTSTVFPSMMCLAPAWMHASAADLSTKCTNAKPFLKSICLTAPYCSMYICSPSSVVLQARPPTKTMCNLSSSSGVRAGAVALSSFPPVAAASSLTGPWSPWLEAASEGCSSEREAEAGACSGWLSCSGRCSAAVAPASSSPRSSYKEAIFCSTCEALPDGMRVESFDLPGVSISYRALTLQIIGEVEVKVDDNTVILN